ncbi:MAG: DNA-binding protein [Proteobacteria bacterium]|nr:DNA-binding protein [Pseudomonadota bacterium]NIS71821.1 DNA-binding protein [Pseudomonadota bacterium]
MTKADLIAAVAKEAKITKTAAEKAVNACTSSVTSALRKGDKITLTGFGTFSVAKRRARKGRNPRTGREISIPASKVAKFKPGNKLRSAVK